GAAAAANVAPRARRLRGDATRRVRRDRSRSPGDPRRSPAARGASAASTLLRPQHVVESAPQARVGLARVPQELQAAPRGLEIAPDSSGFGHASVVEAGGEAVLLFE